METCSLGCSTTSNHLTGEKYVSLSANVCTIQLTFIYIVLLIMDIVTSSFADLENEEEIYRGTRFKREPTL